MRNFYEVTSHAVFNCSQYVKEWEGYLGVYDQNGQEKKGAIQSVGSQVKNLWNSFNQDRLKLDKHYMDSGLGSQAYMASFLLPNIERVFALLVKDENIFVFESLLLRKEELVLVDFGCGPMSGTVGVLCLIEYILSQNEKFKIPKKITVYAIDRSEKIIELGKKIIDKSINPEINFEIKKVSSPAKIDQKVDITLCLNVFNEIPEKHHLSTLKSLYKNCEDGGCFLIMEPGQEHHAKNLGTLRDNFILDNDDCQIISPCAHKKSCPLSSKTARKDWCWFRHAWNPPKLMNQIDKFSKVDHHELNFSYLFFQKNKIHSQELFFARCVSDEFQVDLLNNKTHFEYLKNNLVSGQISELTEMVNSNQELNKILLCTHSGDLESSYVIADPDEKEYRRGRRVKDDLELYIRAKERT